MTEFNAAATIVTKIQDGTRSDETDLCRTCSRSHIMEGAALSSRITYCDNIFNKPIRGRIAKCNRYYPKNLPSIHDLYQIAWTLETDKKKQYGFVSPKERDNRNIPTPPVGF